MAKQGFKNKGNFHLTDNSAAGSALTSGMISKDVGGIEHRFLHNNGINSVYLGDLAGPAVVTDITSGVNNVGVGAGALGSINTTGASQAQNNTAVGGSALLSLTTGSGNVAISSLAHQSTGSDNTAVGSEAGQAVGGASGITTGSRNCLLGRLAGSNYTSSESDNIIIGYLAAGTVGESNVLRVGTGTGTGNGQLNKAFIAGIYGVTIDAGTGIPVNIDVNNQLGTVVSSLRYKTNVQELGSQSEVIYNLKPKSFEYRAYPGSQAWGLIAEEVDEVFPQLCVYKDGQPETVKYQDLVPLLLNEIQKLNNRLKVLENKIV